jgi:hypothetical protein
VGLGWHNEGDVAVQTWELWRSRQRYPEGHAGGGSGECWVFYSESSVGGVLSEVEVNVRDRQKKSMCQLLVGPWESQVKCEVLWELLMNLQGS